MNGPTGIHRRTAARVHIDFGQISDRVYTRDQVFKPPLRHPIFRPLDFTEGTPACPSNSHSLAKSPPGQKVCDTPRNSYRRRRRRPRSGILRLCRCSRSSSANTKANAAWRRSDFDTTTPCAGSRSRSGPRVAGPDHREGRSFRRPRHPNWPSPLHRIRHRCRHRLAPGQAALRPRVRPVAGLRLQVPVSKDRLLQVGTFHARGSATFDLHDVGSVAGGLGTQHPCRRGAALLDHLPDDGREILMARPNLCYLPA
jgi:hypothetical protein